MSDQINNANEQNYNHLDRSKFNLSTAQKIYSESKKVDEKWLLNPDFYKNICNAILDFFKVTEWLNDKLTEENSDASRIEFIHYWNDIAIQILETLRKTTDVYTSHEDLFGMSNGDCSLSNLFLNLEKSKYETRPYFFDSLRYVVKILLRIGKIDLANQFALMSAIEAIWDQYRYEKDDPYIALTEVPDYFLIKGEYNEYLDNIIKTLDWLYEFSSEWGLQYDAYLYILQIQTDLLENFGRMSDAQHQKIIEYWKKVIKNLVYPLHGGLVFEDYLLSNLIDKLVKIERYDDAFDIVEARLQILISDGKNMVDEKRLDIEELLKYIQNLQKMGFELKDHNDIALRTTLDMIKSTYLETNVSELANRLGFKEKGEREWEFKSEDLHKFIKDKTTKTVEIDVHQNFSKHSNGKERKILFLAECKYTKEPVKSRAVEFFYLKAKDILEQQTSFTKPFPQKLVPKIGKLWFISVNGFNKRVLNKNYTLKGCKLMLLDGNELNKLFSKNNMRKIPPIARARSKTRR